MVFLFNGLISISWIFFNLTTVFLHLFQFSNSQVINEFIWERPTAQNLARKHWCGWCSAWKWSPIISGLMSEEEAERERRRSRTTGRTQKTQGNKKKCGMKKKGCWDWGEGWKLGEQKRAKRWDEEEGGGRLLRGIWRWHKSKFKYIIHGSLCQNIIYVCCVDSWLVKWEGHEKKERMEEINNSGGFSILGLKIKKAGCILPWLIRH